MYHFNFVLQEIVTAPNFNPNTSLFFVSVFLPYKEGEGMKLREASLLPTLATAYQFRNKNAPT